MPEQDLLVRIAVLEARIEEKKEALMLQAREYERRLEVLNHAHQQQVERNAQYVSREAWEGRNKEVDTWRTDIDRWRWISIGVGAASGGAAALLVQTLIGK